MKLTRPPETEVHKYLIFREINSFREIDHY